MQATTPSPLSAPTAWRAPLLVKASAACHLGAVAAICAEPAVWPWAAGFVALNHGVVSAVGLWPRSTWLGVNVRRLPAAAAARREFAMTLDDGPEPEVTPQVLDLLDAHGARATFFCIAQQAERHPALCREIVRRGHSVQNHSDRHSVAFAMSGPRGFRREIQQAQDRLAQVTGQLPRYFRAPAGLRNPFLDWVLHTLGLTLVSWTRRGFDTNTRSSAVVLERLARNLAAGDIVLLHDRHSAQAASGAPVVLEVLPALLRRFADAGLHSVPLPDGMRGGS